MNFLFSRQSSISLICVSDSPSNDFTVQEQKGDVDYVSSIKLYNVLHCPHTLCILCSYRKKIQKSVSNRQLINV